MNANPSPWYKSSLKAIRIVSLNCAGLRAHSKDIVADDTLLKGDIINLIETSLEENEENPLNLVGYASHCISVG